jgi:hypothetical protein
MRTDPCVAFASGFPHCLAVCNLDAAAPLSNETGSLQRAGDQGDTGTAYAEHLSQKLLSQTQAVGLGQIPERSSQRHNRAAHCVARVADQFDPPDGRRGSRRGQELAAVLARSRSAGLMRVPVKLHQTRRVGKGASSRRAHRLRCWWARFAIAREDGRERPLGPPYDRGSIRAGPALVEGIQRDEVLVLRIRAEGVVLGLIAV